MGDVRRSSRIGKNKRLKIEANADLKPVSSKQGTSRMDQMKLSGSSVDVVKVKRTNETGYKSSRTGMESTSPFLAEINPLQNAVILDHLFKLCPAKLLANCRLVCKQWYYESMVTWRTSFPLTFTMENDCIFLTNRFHKPLTLHIRLQKYLDYVNNTTNQCATRPYTNFNFVNCKFDSNPEQFQVFWEALGSKVTTLELRYCTFSTVEEFRNIVYKSCPNLRRITFEECTFPTEKPSSGKDQKVEYVEPVYGKHRNLKFLTFYPDQYEGRNKLPVPWLELFSHFPSLTHATFAFGVRDSRIKEFENLAEAIRAVRRAVPNALPFKCFHLGPGLEISANQDQNCRNWIDVVRELHLPLKSLVVQGHPGLDEAFVKDTLSYLAENLKILFLDAKSKCSLFMLREFPFGIQLDNLVNFQVAAELCVNLQFLKYMPRVERLHVFDSTTTNRDMGGFIMTTKMVDRTCAAEMAQVKMKKLTTLSMECGMSDADLGRLFQWMPNVVKLGMLLSDKQVGIVCGKWRNLVELEVFGYDLTDAGVTGMKKAGKTLPNVTYLQNLEKFTCWTRYLTDDSLFHGLLKLPHLRKIKTCFWPAKWGKKGRNALKRRKIVLKERLPCMMGTVYTTDDY